MSRARDPAPVAAVLSHSADAVSAGGLLFVAGILPVDRPARSSARTTSSHRRSTCSASSARSWTAGGCTVADVVKVTVFLTDVADRPLVNPVRQRLFGETRPASTLVEVSGLAVPGARIEVDAVAARAMSDTWNAIVTPLERAAAARPSPDRSPGARWR